MALELMRCPNCAAKVAFASDKQITTCEFCGSQIALGKPAIANETTSLGETIWLKINATLAVPLVTAGASLPASSAETIGSMADGQVELHVDLLAGLDSNPAGNRALASVVYPLANKRSRGMPVAQLKLGVARDGSVTLELREEGTTNVRHYDGFRVALRS